MDVKDFKFKTSVRVRFNEVDMLGVCHNAAYLIYFENARLQYLKELGLVPEKGLFSDGKLFFVVRNEIDYRSNARYDDELDVYTKISFIKNSSFGFDHLILNAATGSIISEGKGIIVQVDPATGSSLSLPEKFTDAIKQFEYKVDILKNL